MKKLKLLLGGLIFLILSCMNNVLAHDARPVAITITEKLPGIFQFSLKVPPTVESNNYPTLSWPESCISLDSSSATTRQGLNQNIMQCQRGLSGEYFSLDYPLFNPSLATFYRLTTQDGGSLTSMLSPTESAWQVPMESSRLQIMKEYLNLGVEHILSGLDHLLFVLGLLVIARSMKRILFTVTGFTLAHSITLSLSALGFISIPVVPVEATIALSIVFLAYEISREKKDSLTYRYPVIISFGFGLLHGLGFASALGEIGMVPGEILLSLLFFNLGVELGQILFILLVLAVVALLYKLLKNKTLYSQTLSLRRVDLLTSYVIGIPAAYWLIDRIFYI